MITDSMTKHEVMKTLRKEFDEEILPYYNRYLRPKIRVVITSQSIRKKQTINLGWEEKRTINNTIFKILKRGNVKDYLPLFVCEFRWRGRMCYGNFFKNGTVVIFQSHALQRYTERILNKNLDIETVFYKYIVKSQEHAYSIVLPTPTHPFSYYFGLANALFLGDYDNKHPDNMFMWCSTCISYNEARYSQSKIMKSLHEINNFVKSAKMDYTNPEANIDLKNHIQKISNDEQKITELKKFFIQKYLLWQLHLSFNFDFTNHFKKELDEVIPYIEKCLVGFGITPKSLSPFSKTHGIAWRGEIDYKGSI